MKLNIRFTTPQHSRMGLLLLFLLLLPAMFVLGSWRASNSQNAVPHAPAVTGFRQYYLSSEKFVAPIAPLSCATGYHFASLWEIADVSELSYNSDLGYVAADGGQGPPAITGWIRTGVGEADTSQSVGAANCDLWETNASDTFGSVAGLITDWENGTPFFGYWNTAVAACRTQRPVWCVQDEFPQQGIIYLPQIQNQAVFGQ